MKYIILNAGIILFYPLSVWFALWDIPISELDPSDRVAIIVIGLFVLAGLNAAIAIVSEDV